MSAREREAPGEGAISQGKPTREAVRKVGLPDRARRLGTWLRPYATLANYILAIVGAMILGGPLLQWVGNILLPPEIPGTARPICEPFPFHTEIPDPGYMKLMGAEIVATKTLAELRLTMRGILWVKFWGMRSSGLSVEEQDQFMARLPTGPISGPITTPPLPTLPADTVTYLVAVVQPDNENCGKGRWLDMRMPVGKVYVTDPSEQVLRDLNFVYDLGSPWRLGLIAAMVVVPIFLFRRRRAVFNFLAEILRPRHPS